MVKSAGNRGGFLGLYGKRPFDRPNFTPFHLEELGLDAQKSPKDSSKIECLLCALCT